MQHEHVTPNIRTSADDFENSKTDYKLQCAYALHSTYKIPPVARVDVETAQN